LERIDVALETCNAGYGACSDTGTAEATERARVADGAAGAR
jgi:hypothetical protein